MDSFNQSLQILGSRVAPDTEEGADPDSTRAAPVHLDPADVPTVPYPVADPAGLRELQNAMGATDEEMAILQQLGGAGPIWGPVKSETSALDEEEVDEKTDIMDLDRQRSASEELRVRGVGATAAGSDAAGAASGVKATGDTPAASGADAAHRRATPQAEPTRRQPTTRAVRMTGSSLEGLLRAYEAKEMVCPSCHRFFLGLPALERHITVAHQGQVGPPPLKKSRTSTIASSVSKRGSGTVGWPVAGTSAGASGSSELGTTTAAPSLGTTADAPQRLACPHCRELLAGKEAFAAHIAEDHPTSMTATGSTTTGSPLPCSEEAEGLKTHISTALGGLLDRALNNLLERGLSPGLNAPTLSLLQKLTARRPTTNISTPRTGIIYNTELAKQVRQQLMTKPKVGLSMLRASSVIESHPYVCFYCESRFEQQSTRNRHMVRVHKDEIVSAKPKYSVKHPPAEIEDDGEDASGGEDSDHSWREPSPTNWGAEPSGGDMGGDGDFLCSDCGINFSTPQEVLAHRKAEHSRPEPPPTPTPTPTPPPPKSRSSRGGRGRGASRPPPTSPPDTETIRMQAMAALRELGAQSRRGSGRGGQAKWGMRFPLAPAEGVIVKTEPGAAFSLPMVRKSSGSGPRFTSLEKRRGKKTGDTVSVKEEPAPGPSPARLDVYEFADEETLAERPELQRRVPPGTVVAVPDTTTAAETSTEKVTPSNEIESPNSAQPVSSEAAQETKEEVDADRPGGGRPQRRERRRKSCADFPSDLSDVLDESDSDDARRPTVSARGSASSRGGRRQRRGGARGGSAATRARGRGRGRGRRPAHTALAVTGAVPPTPVTVSASSEDEDIDVDTRPPAKVLCRSATPDDSSQSSGDVKGGAVALGAAAARRRRRRAKSDLLISVFRAKARHVPASAVMGADSSEDGAVSGGTDLAV